MSDKASNSKSVNDKDLDDLLNSEYLNLLHILTHSIGRATIVNANYVI